MNDQAKGISSIQTLADGSGPKTPTEVERAVPGHFDVSLDDQRAVKDLIQAELSTNRISRLSPLLFLASRPENISPLHHQSIKGRHVCITERPDLHLLWYYDRIFIKPIPKFLLSEAFRTKYILGNESGVDFRPEGIGFLRTYARLITHESDFSKAHQLGLIPSSVSWEYWCKFIQNFKYRRDREVTKRYHFGEIRLSRLNICNMLMEGEPYLEMCHNYVTFFSTFSSLCVFILGATTVLLTGVQTGLADNYPYSAYYSSLAIRVVPLMMVFTLLVVIFGPVLLVSFYLKEVYLYLRRKESQTCESG